MVFHSFVCDDRNIAKLGLFEGYAICVNRPHLFIRNLFINLQKFMIFSWKNKIKLYTHTQKQVFGHISVQINDMHASVATEKNILCRCYGLACTFKCLL